MPMRSASTLRLNMAQWQGGNQPEYHFGAQLLAWLVPATEGPVETIVVPEPEAGGTLSVENGMRGRSAVMRQAREARASNREAPAGPHSDAAVFIGIDRGGERLHGANERGDLRRFAVA
jgi:hypothetical protein